MACEDLTRLLRPLLPTDLPQALTGELVNVVAAIESADELFPAIEHNPPRPLLCLDPRGNRDAEGKSQCWGVIAHVGLQLCEPCLKLEKYVAAEQARLRAAKADTSCREDGCEARREKKGMCAGHYMKQYRAAKLRRMTTEAHA